MRFLIFMLFSITASGQNKVQLRQILDELNNKIPQFESGRFSCTSIWKSSMKTDTVFHAGEIFFSRRHCDRDSISDFALVKTNGQRRVYDGTAYYSSDTNGVLKSRLEIPANSHIFKITMGHGEGRLIFYPYLFSKGKSAFNLQQFERYTLDTLFRQGKPYARISRYEVRDNDAKTFPSDPDSLVIHQTWEFSIPDIWLSRATELITFTELPQYKEIRLSPIFPLPDTVSFQSFLDPIADFDPEKFKRPIINKALPDTLPEFSLMDLDHRRYTKDSLRSQLVLFDFWYKSCAPCQLSMPTIARIREKYGPMGLEVLGVNPVDKEAESLKAFVRKMGINHPTLSDSYQSSLVKPLMISSYPTFLLYHPPTNKIVYRGHGFDKLNTEQELSEQIEKILKK